MIVEFTLNHFIGCLVNQSSNIRREQAEGSISLGGRFFAAAQGLKAGGREGGKEGGTIRVDGSSMAILH